MSERVAPGVGYNEHGKALAAMGADSTAKLVEIRGPSEIMQKFENVKPGQWLKATEPAP